MNSTASITLAGCPLSVPRHVCAFFNSEEEAYRVLLPFVKEGFEQGDKAVHILSADQRAEHVRRLAEAGIDAQSEQSKGTLELKDTRQVYLSEGRFDSRRMLATFESMSSGMRDQRSLQRFVCQMDWASDAASDVEQLVEFEAQVNDLWCRSEDAVVCCYQLQRFGAETVMDILRTHPMVIIGGILQRNPFFTPPDQFLGELQQRRARRAGSI